MVTWIGHSSPELLEDVPGAIARLADHPAATIARWARITISKLSLDAHITGVPAFSFAHAAQRIGQDALPLHLGGAGLLELTVLLGIADLPDVLFLLLQG